MRGNGAVVRMNHCGDGVRPEFWGNVGIVEHGGDAVLHCAPETLDWAVLLFCVRG